jgi:hypothetical protein
MSPLPSREVLRQRKAKEHAEIERYRQRVLMEQRGLEESIARYWELLGEFLDRAEELGIPPETYESSVNKRANTRLGWVEGYRLRSGSIVSAPPSRYSLLERRLLSAPSTEVLEVTEISIFVAETDPGLATGLSEPRTASQGGWPPFERWDRAVNILLALEAELEASLLELMDTV